MSGLLTRRRVETAAAALLAVAAGIVGIAGREQRLGPKFLALEKVGTFREPVHLAQPPRGARLFVAERGGRVRVVGPDGVAKQPFLDLTDRVKASGPGGDQGLLALAFAPDYARSGLLYVAYTDRHDDLRVVEYARSADSDQKADPTSARDVLTIPYSSEQSVGGQLLFGPDRRLYVGSGDGSDPANPGDASQDPTVLPGKLLRIDPRPALQAGRFGPRPYRIPKDNPFVGLPGRDEIYAWGLHDPWRFSFDRATGALTVGDAGGERFQEVDYLVAGRGRGANFGWPAYEGFARHQGGIPKRQTAVPALVYGHRRGCSVVGGYVLRDPSLARIAGRELVGRYLFGDRCSGRVYAVAPRIKRAGRERKLRFKVPDLTSFGEDVWGRVYMVSGKGGVWRLAPRRKRH